jgi:hypothetical protein
MKAMVFQIHLFILIFVLENIIKAIEYLHINLSSLVFFCCFILFYFCCCCCCCVVVVVVIKYELGYVDLAYYYVYFLYIKTVLKRGVFSDGIEFQNPSLFFIDALNSHILSLCL